MSNRLEADREIINRLEEAGLPIRDLDRISVTKNGSEIVYQAETTDRTVFVRTVGASRREGVRRVLATDLDIGLPESRLLDGDPPLLVMERANGRPLSLLLPVYFLPIIWRTVSNELTSGFESLGRYHGRLHEATGTDQIRVADNDTYASKIEPSNAVRNRLGFTMDRLQPWLDRVRDVELSRGLVHSDPTPHNVYYRNGDVELIDVDLKHTAVLKDRLAVECGIELMAGRLPYGRSFQSTRLLDAYDRGYDAEYTHAEIPYWAYLTLKAAHYAWILDIYLSGENTAIRDRLTSVTDTNLIVDRIDESVNVLGKA